MSNGYFVTYLKDGTVLDFNKKCNSVDYTGTHMALFKDERERCYTTLALIPYENINHISRKDKTNE